MYCGLGPDDTTTAGDDSGDSSDDAGDGDGGANTDTESTTASTDDDTSTTTDDSVAEGTGTSFCEYHAAIRYCEDDGNSDCPSCTQLAMQANPVCKANPVACLPSISNDQLQAYQAQCPLDPVYVSTSYIQNNSSAGTQPTTLPGTEQVDSLSDISGSGDGAIDYSEAQNNRGGVSETFSVSSPRTPAGVGDALGESLFTANSNVYIEKCDNGQLNNCGPLAGL